MKNEYRTQTKYLLSKLTHMPDYDLSLVVYFSLKAENGFTLREDLALKFTTEKEAEGAKRIIPKLDDFDITTLEE